MKELDLGTGNIGSLIKDTLSMCYKHGSSCTV